MLCLLHTFSDLWIRYTGHLWQDEDLVLDEARLDWGSMIYLITFALHPLPPLCLRPPLLLSPPLLVILHIPIFVMILSPGYAEPRSQPSSPLSFLHLQPPLLGGEARTSPILGPSPTPSPTPSQLGLQGAQASLFTSLQGSTNQRVELRYDGKSW